MPASFCLALHPLSPVSSQRTTADTIHSLLRFLFPTLCLPCSPSLFRLCSSILLCSSVFVSMRLCFQLFLTRQKGWGVRSRALIAKREYLADYAGFKEEKQ